MSTKLKHTIEPVHGSDAWRVNRDGTTLITTHATDGARQLATEIAIALDGTAIPTPVRLHLDAERRELIREAPAMARVLEGLAKSLRAIVEREPGSEAALAEFTWHMESLATQGLTAKALARSAADLARMETLVRALDNATANALAAAEATPSTKLAKREPTDEQRAALASFAARHGRTWKAKLLAMWANGRDANEPEGGLLRQVRNAFGPSWLESFQLARSAGAPHDGTPKIGEVV